MRRVSEVKRIAAGMSIVEETSFPGSKLAYRLEVTENDGVAATFDADGLVVSLPKAEVQEWAETDRVSLFAEQDLGDAGVLSLLIEKDFKCLEPGHHRDCADDDDTFPHPSAQ